MRIVEQVSSNGTPGPVDVRTLSFRLLGEEQRVVLLSFTSGDKLQIQEMFLYLQRLSDADVAIEFERMQARYSSRHEHFEVALLQNYGKATIAAGCELEGRMRWLLAGSYFSMEYAFQASALFNPSIVPHPDQSGLPIDSTRFVMSLRAVGEGHTSSVVFHTGIVESNGGVKLDPAPSFMTPTQFSPDRFHLKSAFHRKLLALGFERQIVDECLAHFPDSFSMAELERFAEEQHPASKLSDVKHLTCLERIFWLGRANYELQLAPEHAINEMLLFPKSANESRGIEDLRLVRLKEDDGSTAYYGTYTAFNGSQIFPMLLSTPDFRRVSVQTLNGACAQNKGMALFPRRVNGHYAMCSRIDGRNLFLMYSDDIHTWESAQRLAVPQNAWEYRLIGNCGSPLETPEGWLLITHGVGPMRQYGIGAMLLDRQDPSIIRGRLRVPLIVSTENEREGYVPNVVYSCGSLICNQRLILPYAISDRKTAVAEIELAPLLQKLLER